MNKIVLPASHPFAGIADKLNRSHENILNLQAEIARFFEDSEYPVLTDEDDKILAEAIEYHTKRIIPQRFSVLSGEIVHHLRSCFDHIVWHFSDVEHRRKHIKSIGFPVLKERPAPADVLGKYERKIKGIKNRDVLNLIKRLQPYNLPNPLDSLLLAIHEMDIIDKHQALVIVIHAGAFEYPAELQRRYLAHKSGIPCVPPFDLTEELKRYGKLIPQVAFSDFCWGESEPVVQALTGMHNYVIDIVEVFDKFAA